MTSFRLDPEVLEPLVREVFGSAATIAAVEPIGEWSVARVRVIGGEGVRRSVVVKTLRALPSGARAEASRILNERAAMEFLAGVDPDIAPRLLAESTENGVVMLEDLEPLVALNELLVGGDPRGRDGLRVFAQSLARLHGLTVGRADEYYRLRGELGPADPTGDARMVLSSEWEWRLPDLSASGFGAPLAAQSELRAAQELLCPSGPFTAFSNGDPGLHNFLTDGTRARIIDWEDAGFGHCARDAACLWVPNSIWMTIASPVGLGLDRVYREALSPAIPEVRTSVFDEALAAACTARAADRLSRFPLLDGRPLGHESRAQMIFTLEAAAHAAERLRSLPALSRWAQDAATFLRARWPDADCDFPDAYTTRADWDGAGRRRP